MQCSDRLFRSLILLTGARRNYINIAGLRSLILLTGARRNYINIAGLRSLILLTGARRNFINIAGLRSLILLTGARRNFINIAGLRSLILLTGARRNYINIAGLRSLILLTGARRNFINIAGLRSLILLTGARRNFINIAGLRSLILLTGARRNFINIAGLGGQGTITGEAFSSFCLILSSRAGAMCRVTIFVVATEDAGKGCQITQTKGAVPDVIAYEKRVCAYLVTPCPCSRAHCRAALLHLRDAMLHASTQDADALWVSLQLAAQFPKPEGPEAIIDVSQFEERQLTGAYGDTYPLIIRLECVSDKGKTETHQLQVASHLACTLSACLSVDTSLDSHALIKVPASLISGLPCFNGTDTSSWYRCNRACSAARESLWCTHYCHR